MPAIRLINSEKRLRYVYEGDVKSITQADIVKFVNDYKEGNLRADLKSQAIPETVTAEGMTTLVGKNHDEFVTDPTKDVLVEYYAPWCGHCKKLAPVWADLAKKTEGIENLIIAQMDSTENETDKATITGFPTVMFYPAV